MGLKKAFFFPALFVVIIWMVHAVNWTFNGALAQFGIYPRDFSHWYGIILSPFIHGISKESAFGHIISNTLPFLVLGTLMFTLYERIAHYAMAIIWLSFGLGVFLFARGNSYHIGASGLIYGFAAFLFFMGIFRHDVKSIAIAALVSIFYGGMVWGILPIQEGVSWEGHLFGGIGGILAAYLFRKKLPMPEVYERIENEPDTKTFDDFLKKLEE
ncbi:MAG: rhomboid family intramembrane serine protease [Chitinophagales bacterium]|nr:rhomboid family intramembrane serine protease [Chitinophagales bacterium]